MKIGEIAPAQHGETPSGCGLLQLVLHSSETRDGRRCSTPVAAQSSARAAARARGGGAAGARAGLDLHLNRRVGNVPVVRHARRGGRRRGRPGRPRPQVADGPGRARGWVGTGWVGPMGSAQSGRIRFLFFLKFFSVQNQIQKKCFEALKILRKSQKF
jgi:hypothetical protein